MQDCVYYGCVADARPGGTSTYGEPPLAIVLMIFIPLRNQATAG